MSRQRIVGGILALLSSSMAATGPAQEEKARYEPVADEAAVRGQPYRRYFAGDAFGRRSVFYVSEEPEGGAALPLVAYVHGSGAQSHFVEANGRVEGRTGHNAIADVVRGRARLVIVEKPGVTFLDAPADPGGSTHASELFRSEHTLERWAEAVHAALEAARRLPDVRDERVLVVGHSEGGIVAAKLAADHDWITHVAVLAGGGPTQLFDLVELARRGEFFDRVSDDPKERVEYVLGQWRAIQADPLSSERLFFGHPYRRWSSFLATSTLEQLLASDARVFVAQGAEDRAVTRASFDVLQAELVARGRDARFELVAGADHSFSLESGGARTDGWGPLFQRIVSWFLNE